MFEHKALYHVFEARAGHEGDAWSTKLQVSMLQFANVYEQFVDSVSNCLRTYSMRDVPLMQQPRTVGRQGSSTMSATHIDQ